MSNKMVGDQALAEIEKTQQRLRNSIEESRRLAEDSERMIKAHRHDLKQQAG